MRLLRTAAERVQHGRRVRASRPIGHIGQQILARVSRGHDATPRDVRELDVRQRFVRIVDGHEGRLCGRLCVERELQTFGGDSRNVCAMACIIRLRRVAFGQCRHHSLGQGHQ